MILGLSGQARVGKDTFADYLVHNYDFVKIGLADPMKRFCKDVFDFSDAQLYGDERDKPDGRYFRGVVNPASLGDNYLTPRYALQKLGTEWGRDCYNSIWVEYGVRVATRLLGGYCRYSPSEGLVSVDKDIGPIGGVVFSDLRFRNEFETVKKAQGKMIRIYRPGHGGNVGIEGHASEAEQQTIQDREFDLVVNNDGSLIDYYRAIDAIMATVLKNKTR